MNFIAKFLNTLYSFYAFGSFFITLFLSFFFYLAVSWLPERRRLRTIYTYNKNWFDIWGMFTGIVMQTKGEELLDAEETYVLVGNHCNVLDIIIVGSRVVHPFKPLIKKELLRVPVLGMMLKMISIVVDRSSTKSRVHSYQRMVSAIKNKVSVLVFPEGTRNRSMKPLKPFYDGAFKLAIDTQAPIMPILLLNVRSLNPVGTFNVKPGKIIMEYLAPIPTKGLTHDDIPDLKKEVWERMEQKIIEGDNLFKQEIQYKNISPSIGRTT